MSHSCAMLRPICSHPSSSHIDIFGMLPSPPTQTLKVPFGNISLLWFAPHAPFRGAHSLRFFGSV